MTVKSGEMLKNEIFRITELSKDKFLKDFKALCCKHKWENFGLGYKCSLCDFYTGTNSVLNDAIKDTRAPSTPKADHIAHSVAMVKEPCCPTCGSGYKLYCNCHLQAVVESKAGEVDRATLIELMSAPWKCTDVTKLDNQNHYRGVARAMLSEIESKFVLVPREDKK